MAVSSAKPFLLENATHMLVNFMPGKYEVYKDAVGKFRFRLRAENNEIVAMGEAYEQHASCLNGIKSLKKNCGAEIEDLTVEGERLVNPKYEVFTDAFSKFRFRLKASNGEIIAQSEGYETKEGCMKGITAFKNNCSAEVEDQTRSSTAKTPVAKDVVDEKLSVGETKSTPSVEALRKIVFVGNKMPMDYVLAIITGFSSSNAKEITLKARGQAIATAVDAAEITRRRFVKDLKVDKITTGTEEMPARQGETRSRMVSTIEIKLTRQ